MTQTESIIIVIWAIGVVFNILLSKKVFPEYETSGSDGFLDIFLMFFMLPFIMLEYICKMVFIFGSWGSWIVIGIMYITEKIKDKYGNKMDTLD